MIKKCDEQEKQRRMGLMREKAAQAWCHSTTSKIDMDVVLAEVFAEMLYVEFYSPSLGQ